MKQLFSIITDSFAIWVRNFSLVYVLLLGLMLTALLSPKEAMPSLDTRWLFMSGILLLLMGSFIAGWFNMIATACRRFIERSKLNTSTSNDMMDNLTLFKAFLPGISMHLLSVTANFLILGGLIFLFSVLIQPLWEQNIGFIEAQVARGHFDPQALLSLPPKQLEQMQELALLFWFAFICIVVFMMLTALWPAFVTLYGDNIFKAYWQSILKFFRDPFRFLFLTALYLGSQLVFMMISAALAPASTLLGVTIQLFGLMFSIYAMITLFMYTIRTTERPLMAEPLDEPTPKQPDDDAEDEQDNAPF